MNNNVKLLVGAGIGAAIGWFVGSVVVEIIKIKEFERDGDWIDGIEYDAIVEDEFENPNGDKETYQKPSKSKGSMNNAKNYTQFFSDQGRPDLAQLAAKYNGEETIEYAGGDQPRQPAPVLDEEEEFSEPEDDGIIQPISIISLAEFANAEEFETLTLNYYDDDVVTDEHDNPIDRPERILGEDALISFGELSDDEDVVYVRNLPKKAMYEVVRTNKTYAAQFGPKTPTRRRAPLSKKEEDDGEDNT